MYRTGDLARYLEDGLVEFLGRGDDQVKVRGFRIELGEIEAVLSKHAGVKQAVVLAREDQNGDKRLVGYVVASREPNVSAEELKSYLQQQLPDYMVPQAVVLLPKLPLTANGKIDRAALPQAEVAAQAKAYVAPRNEIEKTIVEIWAEVLRREAARISVEDNFFDLGGHSLLATQVISRLRQRLKVEVAVKTMFDGPIVSTLAKAVEQAPTIADETELIAIAAVSRQAFRV
jgi:acyl carrier protein